MSDGDLRQLFRARVPPPMHWQSIETGGTGRGIPDANFCAEGVEGWVEYKMSRTRAIHLRPEQVAWLLQRERHGGRTFVAVRYRTDPGPRRGARQDVLYLFRGSLAMDLVVEGLWGTEGRALGAWPGGPSSWSWPEVRRLLLAP